RNPAKVYSNAGSYNVTLTVSNALGSNTAYSTVVVQPGGPACGSATSLCLGGRFDVSATWAKNASSGSGVPIPLTSDTGYFWFFSSDNVELVLKVLDGRTINHQFWVFAAGLTDVAVDIRVTDTQTSQVKTYRNPAGVAFIPIEDTRAF